MNAVKSKCDNGNVNASNFANAGGNWNNADNAGAFQVNVNYSTADTNGNIGTHIMVRSK